MAVDWGLLAAGAADGDEPREERWREEVREETRTVADVLAGERQLVLLDGLDEVFDEDHRRWVSQEVWRLMSYSQARFVLCPAGCPSSRWSPSTTSASDASSAAGSPPSTARASNATPKAGNRPNGPAS